MAWQFDADADRAVLPVTLLAAEHCVCAFWLRIDENTFVNQYLFGSGQDSSNYLGWYVDSDVSDIGSDVDFDQVQDAIGGGLGFDTWAYVILVKNGATLSAYVDSGTTADHTDTHPTPGGTYDRTEFNADRGNFNPGRLSIAAPKFWRSSTFGNLPAIADVYAERPYRRSVLATSFLDVNCRCLTGALADNEVGTAVTLEGTVTFTADPSGITGDDPPDGDLTLEPAGLVATSAVGNVQTQVVAVLAGLQAQGAVGAALGVARITPSGLAVVGSVGDPGLDTGGLILQPAGLEAATSVGDAQADVVLLPSGQVAMAQLADGIELAELHVTPEGLEATGDVGAPAVTGVFQPSGLQADADVGAVSLPGQDLTLTPAGLAASTAVGDTDIDAILAVLGLQADADVGNPNLQAGDLVLQPSGLAVLGRVGTFEVTGQWAPGGQEASGSVGDVGAVAVLTPTAVTATTGIGTPGLIGPTVYHSTRLGTVTLGYPKLTNVRLGE